MDIDAIRIKMLLAQFGIIHPYRDHQGIGENRDESIRHAGGSPGNIAEPFWTALRHLHPRRRYASRWPSALAWTSCSGSNHGTVLNGCVSGRMRRRGTVTYQVEDPLTLPDHVYDACVAFEFFSCSLQPPTAPTSSSAHPRT